MTPTREQVIEWAKAANILEPIDLLESNQWRDDTIRELERLAALAYSAGRLKGLDEAKVVCKHQAATVTRFTGTREQGANHCAAAIDQLKEQK